MESVTLAEAKEHLEELIERAAKGEDVRIDDPTVGAVRLLVVPAYDLSGPRVIDTMPPFIPLKQPRTLGHLEGQIPLPPDDFFDPLSEDDLKDWYGDAP